MKSSLLYSLGIPILFALGVSLSCSRSVNAPDKSVFPMLKDGTNSSGLVIPVAEPADAAQFRSPSSDGNATVNGGGTTVEGGLKSTFVFNAVMHKDGSVNGHLVYQFREGGLRLELDITCMTISGNRASLFGKVTSVSGANIPGYIFVGQIAIFSVVDNGQGNGAQPDEISDVILGGVHCGESVTTYLPISGNISIKD